ncbi:peroxidase 3-like [Malania oleifera]|uniref:peroxidase 3-like n=1 Tax=Malania oleifera TaxID=397392 RepID=UPI0025ADB7C0|nr:peroxidase 3-like [Malania oleifera]
MKMGGLGCFGIALILMGVVGFSGPAQAQLTMNFYQKSCPNAEQLVKKFVEDHIPNAPSLAATLIRTHFHDCFVRGCDASVLLNFTSTNPSNATEKTATPNLTLRGFSFIDRVKSVVEAACPGVVSCADIIALVARDAIVVTGGPSWNVPTGRRDGVISNQTEALNNIPAPTFNFSALRTSFANKGLDVKDLVLLSGAHTIGIAHCSSFSNRLYNFTGVGDEDPALDSEYAANLKAKKCKTATDNSTIVEMDPGSFRTFDLSYYGLLLKRRGLFQSDAALTTNSNSTALVKQLLQGSLANFYTEFARAMEKMGRVEVKTGSTGEIRKHCALVNS